MATARSGVFHDPSYGGDDRKNVLKRGSVEPGTYYLYNNWDFNAVGYIFEKLVGKTIYEEIEEQIAIPTGFENWDLSIQKKAGDITKSKYLAYPINLSTKDMAKVGQLMLNKGEWNGNRLISENWLKKIVTIVTPKDTVSKRRGLSKFKSPDFGYSYMWWTFDEFNKNNTVLATSGNNKFKFDIKQQGFAWMTSNKKEKIMVKVMKKGSRIMLSGYNEKGSQTIDHYSLLGFTKAYNTAKKACS